MAVGDFNGDGLQDLAACSAFDDTVTVLLGRGDGTFSPTTEHRVGVNALLTMAGDIDHDGTADLATANVFGNTVSVLLGHGDGTFRSASPANSIATRNIPFYQDLDGDGIPDELILNGSGDLLFRRGLGPSGQYAPPVTVNPDDAARDATVFQTPTGWAVAAVSRLENSVSLYRWDAASHSFQFDGGFATGSRPVRIAAAALTGVRRLEDLVVANAFDNSVTIALRQPGGTFSTLTRPVGQGPSEIAFLNVPGRQGPDIVVSNQVSGDCHRPAQRRHAFLSPNFQPAVPLPSRQRPVRHREQQRRANGPRPFGDRGLGRR